MLATLYSSWRNPRCQHHPLNLHSSLSLIALERSWLINQNIILACICPCVDVNLTFQLSCGRIFVRPCCGTILHLVYFRDGCSVDVPFQGKFSRLHLGMHTFPLFVEVKSLRPEIFLVLGFSALC